MTSLLKQLQADQLNARKARDTFTATLLTTVMGEALKVGKDDGNRDSTDSEVIEVVKKFVKNIKQNIIDYGKAGKADAIASMEQEFTILKAYLPAEVDAAVVRDAINGIIAQKSLPKNGSSIGKIMPELNALFGDALDKKMASELVKEALK